MKRTLSSVALWCFSFLIYLAVANPVLAKTYYLQNSASTYFNEAQTIEIEKSQYQWNYEFTVDSFEAETFKASPLADDYHQLSFGSWKLTQTPGRPALPYKSFIVKGHPSQLNVSFEGKKAKTFKSLKASPAPLKPCRCAKDLVYYQGAQYPVDNKSYQQGDAPVVEVRFLGDFRGVPISQVLIHPAIQLTTGLKVYQSLKVQISSEETLELPSFKAQNDRFVVITPRALLAGAQSFKEFKEEDGYQVSLYVYEDVARNAQELKSFIHGLYQREKFQFATLVGHEVLLPPLKVSTSSDPETPSDYPYFAMAPGRDLFPEVFYGRLVADNNEELFGQVAKMREYRDQSWDDAQGSQTSIGIASNEGWDPTDVEYMREMLSPLENSLGWSPDYFFQENSNATVANINNSLNQGARWFNYIGHGSGVSWSSIFEGEYHSRDIENLVPGKVKPVIIDVACQNGRFSYEGKLGERFMNTFKRGQPVGAVAYYGGSVDISWDPPAVMAVAIGKELARQRQRSLFGLIMKGQKYLIENYEDVEAAKENLLWYHLFGDPSMVVNNF